MGEASRFSARVTLGPARRTSMTSADDWPRVYIAEEPDPEDFYMASSRFS